MNVFFRTYKLILTESIFDILLYDKDQDYFSSTTSQHSQLNIFMQSSFCRFLMIIFYSRMHYWFFISLTNIYNNLCS